MEGTIMIRKELAPQEGHVRVTFEIPASVSADHIYLVGDFNNWNRRTLPFQRDRSGVWRITLDLPARRRYQFRYLIDEYWCSDLHADGCTMSDSTPNSFVEATLPLESLASCTGQSMVREAASDVGMDFFRKTPFAGVNLKKKSKVMSE
jgi:hypothetical protein